MYVSLGCFNFGKISNIKNFHKKIANSYSFGQNLFRTAKIFEKKEYLDGPICCQKFTTYHNENPYSKSKYLRFLLSYLDSFIPGGSKFYDQLAWYYAFLEM